jgi:hypothetical protein
MNVAVEALAVASTAKSTRCLFAGPLSTEHLSCNNDGTAAPWLVQASSTEPFSMACSSEGTLQYTINDIAILQLAKVTNPRSCPGTPLSNDHLDLTVER